MNINNFNVFLLCVNYEIIRDNSIINKIVIANLNDNEDLFSQTFLVDENSNDKIYKKAIITKFFKDYHLKYKVLYDGDEFPYKEFNVLFIKITDQNKNREDNIFVLKTFSIKNKDSAYVYSTILKMNRKDHKFEWIDIPVHIKIKINTELNKLKTDDVDNLINYYNFNINEFWNQNKTVYVILIYTEK